VAISSPGFHLAANGDPVGTLQHLAGCIADIGIVHPDEEEAILPVEQEDAGCLSREHGMDPIDCELSPIKQRQIKHGMSFRRKPEFI